METEALLGSVLELARVTDTQVPAIETVYALVTLLGKQPQVEHKQAPAAVAAPP
jgi:ketopantoate reductase